MMKKVCLLLDFLRDWGSDDECYYYFFFVSIIGRKVLGKVPPKIHDSTQLSSDNKKFIPNQEFVDQINNVQSSWKAVVYEDYSGMTVAQLIARAGGPNRLNFPKPRYATSLNFVFIHYFLWIWPLQISTFDCTGSAFWTLSWHSPFLKNFMSKLNENAG